MRSRIRGAAYFREKLLDGDRLALARAITAVENNQPDAQAVFQVINGHLGKAHVIGVTGAPGAGKSSLVNSLTRELRRREKTVGVIAVDPSSPFSGGAILGDRIRMTEHGQDAGVFVRSLASRGHLGGLSGATARVVDIMDASGREVVIVETVGTGQSEVEVMEIAQSVVVVCAPGLGDEIQAVKAGILEIANILVVNKADLPHADRTVQHLTDAMGMGPRRDWMVPVLRTIATTGEGVGELADIAADHYAAIDPSERAAAALVRTRTLIAGAAARQLRTFLGGKDIEDVSDLCDRVLKGELDVDAAGRQAMLRVIKAAGDGPQ